MHINEVLSRRDLFEIPIQLGSYHDDIISPGVAMAGLNMFFNLGARIDFEGLYCRTRDPQYIVGVVQHAEQADGILKATVHLNEEKGPKIEANYKCELRNCELHLTGMIKARDKDNPRVVTVLEVHMLSLYRPQCKPA